MEGKNGYLDAFDSLRSENDKERLKAGLDILQRVNNEATDSEERNRIFKRLLSGVASARHGFFACLSTLLKLSDVSTDVILELINKLWPVGEENLKAHEGEHLVGYVFCLGALIRSRALTEDETELVFARLLKIRNVKTFFGPVCLVFLLQILDKVNNVVFETKLLPLIGDILNKGLESATVDDLSVLLAAEANFRKPMKQMLKHSVGTKRILNSNHLPLFSKSLQQTKTYLPFCHPFLEVVGRSCVNSKYFEELWKVCVVDNLVVDDERGKCQVAFHLAAECLDNSNSEEQVAVILCESVIRRYISYCNVWKTGDLSIVKLTNSLNNALKQTQLQKAVLNPLITPPGSILIDSITKSKLISSIVSSKDSSKEILEFISLVATDVLNSKTSPHSQKKYSAQLLAKLAVHSVMNDISWQLKHSCLLVELGLFVSDPPLPRNVTNAIQDSFYQGLDHPGLSLPILVSLLHQLAQHVHKLLKANVPVLNQKFDDKARSCWKRLMKILLKLDSDMGSVFKLLFLHVSLEMLSNPFECVNSFEELLTCYKKAVSCSSGGLPWVDVVIDMLLSFLSSNSHWSRNMANRTFKQLLPHVTVSTMMHLLETLSPDSKPLDNEDEPMVNGDDGSSESDSSESNNDADDAMESSDDADVDEEFEAKIRDALGPVADNEDEEEDMEITEMDDATAKTVDDALSEVFRQRGGKVPGEKKKKKVEDTSVMHFRIRCLDLVEIYVRSGGCLSVIVAALPMLIGALESASKTALQRPLKDKLINTLRHLAQAKKTNIDDTQDITKVINQIKKVASRLLGEKELSVLSQCNTLLVRCAINSNDDAVKKQVKQIYMTSLKDFFDKSDCSLPFSYFSAPLSLAWVDVWEAAHFLCERAFNNNHRLFKRKQALSLLNTLLRNRLIVDEIDSKSRRKLSETIIQNATELLGQVSKREIPYKEFYMCELTVTIQVTCRNSMVSLDLLQEAYTHLNNTISYKKNKTITKAWTRIFRNTQPT